MRIDELDKFPSLHSYEGAMTHNTFLQVLLNLGLIGCSIVLCQMIFTIRGIFILAIQNDRLCLLFLAMLIPLLVNSMTEFGIWGETNFGIMYYLFIVWGVCLKKKNYEGS